jgi:hypothetical protein
MKTLNRGTKWHQKRHRIPDNLMKSHNRQSGKIDSTRRPLAWGVDSG